MMNDVTRLHRVVKIDELHSECHVIETAVLRLEARMSRERGRSRAIADALKTELRQEIGGIKARIVQLQERVAEFESQL